jgi:hypothetical protein
VQIKNPRLQLFAAVTLAATLLMSASPSAAAGGPGGGGGGGGGGGATTVNPGTGQIVPVKGGHVNCVPVPPGTVCTGVLACIIVNTPAGLVQCTARI